MKNVEIIFPKEWQRNQILHWLVGRCSNINGYWINYRTTEGNPVWQLR